jgi:two-component system phosphate regulon sensor histidine kinase PhoR
VVLLSGAREIRWFNRKAGELLGLRRKVDIGIPIANLLRDPEFVTYLAKPGAGGVVVRMQGRDAWLALFVVPAGDQFLMLVRDVTREVRLEQMRKDFVANASHELRSPLTVISGYLDELVDDDDIGAEWREPLADMRRQARRMREIVEDLLELSRLESTADEAPMEPVDVAAILERVVREARTSAADAPQFELQVEPGCWLRGNETDIYSIASNLVSNAAKYTPADGRVTIRWGRATGGAQLAVQDTGIGIAAEHLPRLTERFYRVDRGRARARGGSGLGLSIVKHALQRHGGWLDIESAEGRGSTFTAHFPGRRVLGRPSAVTKVS